MIEGSKSFENGKNGLQDRLSKLGEKVTTLKSNREIDKYIENIKVHN